MKSNTIDGLSYVPIWNQIVSFTNNIERLKRNRPEKKIEIKQIFIDRLGEEYELESCGHRHLIGPCTPSRGSNIPREHHGAYLGGEL